MQTVQNTNTTFNTLVRLMEKQIGATKARDMLRNILDEVQYKGDKYIIKRHGEPAVAVVPIQIYENWKQQRKRLLELIREVQEANEDADPDEVMAEVLAAQQAVRSK
jgi:prevent-host-death family protein